MLNNNPLMIISAFIPLIWLFFSLWKLKMTAHKAGFTALCLTAGLAFLFYGADLRQISQAALEGIMLSIFPILWVIFSALFVYNITIKSGSMELVKGLLAGISPDRRVQALILAFSFGGFLEAVAGFGTAVAIPAGILAVMGFEPVLAAAVCLIANTIPVAFGVLGVPILTLAQLTSLPLDKLSLFTSLQLIPFILLLPFILVHVVTGSFKNIKGVIIVSLLSAVAFAAAQTLTALYAGPETAAVAGSILSLAVIIVWIRFFPIRKVWRFSNDMSISTEKYAKNNFVSILTALSPYFIMLAGVAVTRFIPAMDFLKEYPFTIRRQFYFGPGGKPMAFDLATSAGSLFFIAALAGGFIQKLSIWDMAGILVKTLIQMWKTAATVVSVVVLAKIMGYSGMVDNVSRTIAFASGRFFPLLAPAVGALGTFLTGSDTSSNVLFGNLQKQTASQLGMDVEWLVSSNASGATAGKMISPQSISIAASATGLGGREGTLLGITLKYCIFYIILMGLVVYLFEKLF